MPGTLWVPAPASGIHHLGYWSDDVAADAARLTARGYAAEATGVRPDGTAVWAYHRSASGPRIELVSRAIAAGLEQQLDVELGRGRGRRSGFTVRLGLSTVVNLYGVAVASPSAPP